MLGEIVEIKKNLWIVYGAPPKHASKSPDVANAIVYKAEDRLYVIDTGVGPTMRQSLERVIESTYPISEFYLLNSHLHIDHICNNKIIDNVQAEKKHHYVSEAGFASLNTYIYEGLLTLDDYYDLFSGYSYPYNMKMMFYKLTRTFRGHKKAIEAFVKMGVKKYKPVHTSRHTMQPLELQPDSEVLIGDIAWKGWDLNDIKVLEVRGHSPDELIFYIPEHKFIFAADLTHELIPMYPTTHREQSIEGIQRCIAMAGVGDIEALADGHHHKVYTTSADVVGRLEKLLANNHRFIELMEGIAREGGALTVDEMYEALKNRQHDSAIEAHFKWDFPRSPSTLRSFICTLMLELGWSAEGKLREKRFSPPTK